MSEAPRDEYERRLGTRGRAAAALAQRDRLLSNWRLAVFALGVALSFAAFGFDLVSGGWLLPVAIVFVALLVAHDRAIRARERADRSVAFYEDGLARLDHEFAGRGEAGERFRDPAHPYAEDLDLFGPGSLFEMLCTVRTHAGEDRLAGWLLAPAEPAAIRARQAAVAELAPRLELREDLALLGEDVRAGLHPEPLRRWGEREVAPVLVSRWLPLATTLASALSLAALGAWIFTGAGPIPLLVTASLQAGLASSVRGAVRGVVESVDAPARDLALFAELLARLEREPFESPQLASLRAALETRGVPPSRRIAQLRRRVELLDSRRNQLFAPIGALLHWTTQLACALERWRATCGPAVGRWIEAVGELEALAALGGHAFERPEHVFPEILEGAPRFEGEGLGHPLLPRDRCVTNDVRLGDDGLRVLVVSGSNMSGKSTLLRTVGTNAVLALAGAPVYAGSLRLTPVSVGASIRVSDSLQEGSSRFYAEIKRLRQVMEIAEGEPPALFLLDEILHGTNSHDRGIGAEAVVRGLFERGALGLVTTHDLALARVAEALAPAAANVHFADHLEEDRMVFDYRMRPGVVAHSNALELMRSVGLDV